MLDPCVAVDPHAPLREHAGERGADPRRVPGQHLGSGGEQLEAQPIGIAPRLAEPGAQSVAHREHHLDTAGPSSHHADPHRAAVGEDSLGERVPAGDEVADRLDRHHRVSGARHAVHARRRPDVDREHVVGHRRPGAADDLALDRIEPDGLVVVETRVRKARQRTKIDVDVVVAVVSGDVAGEHPRVRRLHVAADEGDPHAGHRFHPETLEHDDVAVPAAGEHQILDNRSGVGFHGILPDAAPVRPGRAALPPVDRTARRVPRDGAKRWPGPARQGHAVGWAAHVGRFGPTGPVDILGNRVDGRYSDERHRVHLIDTRDVAPEFVDRGRVSFDGRRLARDLGIKACVSRLATAERLLAIEMRKLRGSAPADQVLASELGAGRPSAMLVTYRLRPGPGFRWSLFTPFDRVLVTDSEAGFTARPFEVLEAAVGADLSVRVSLRESSSGIFDDATVGAIVPMLPTLPSPTRTEPPLSSASPPPDATGVAAVAGAAVEGGASGARSRCPGPAANCPCGRA